MNSRRAVVGMCLWLLVITSVVACEAVGKALAPLWRCVRSPIMAVYNALVVPVIAVASNTIGSVRQTAAGGATPAATGRGTDWVRVAAPPPVLAHTRTASYSTVVPLVSPVRCVRDGGAAGKRHDRWQAGTARSRARASSDDRCLLTARRRTPSPCCWRAVRCTPREIGASNAHHQHQQACRRLRSTSECGGRH